jgi:hypothetical protein
MQQNEPLPFEQFVEREYILGSDKDPIPKYNNFPLHFSVTPIGLFYRGTPHSQRFQREHPDLDTLLCEKMANRDKSITAAESLIPLEPDLYKAYVIMHYYVTSDDILFA